ncbi:MAG: hypothetical protein WCI36_02410 [bacterium]
MEREILTLEKIMPLARSLRKDIHDDQENKQEGNTFANKNNKTSNPCPKIPSSKKDKQQVTEKK